MEILKGKKVLVVDDDPVSSVNHSLLIDKLGASEVFQADNMDSAYSSVITHEVDLIVSDYVMPGGSGLDLYKKLILSNIHVPFAMITGHGDVEAVKEMIELGITAILVKPVTLGMLITRLSRVI